MFHPPAPANHQTASGSSSASSRPSHDDEPYRVLLTGFGPFSRYPVNPSWLAVKPLHNAILDVDLAPIPPPMSPEQTPIDNDRIPIIVNGHGPPMMNGHSHIDTSARPRPKRAHITTVMVPVAYESVLEVTPGFHQRPPVLPPSHDPEHQMPPPPANGYDFVFHVGVAGRGPLRMERLSHKLGYRMKDATGKYAPQVDRVVSAVEVTDMEMYERERFSLGAVEEFPSEFAEPPQRGFGKGYEMFDDELYTDIDVEKLVAYLKQTGIEDVYTSMDAGHYICDFLYYCSIAESRRGLTRQDRLDRRRGTQILFLHCPPVGHPFTTEEVTEAIRRIILWVCRAEPTSP